MGQKETLKNLRECNPVKKIYSVVDPEFETYGNVHSHIHVPHMREYVCAKEMPKEEVYIPSCTELSQMEEAVNFQEYVFGEVPCQIGYYTGFCTTMNALEYHKCSEVLVEFEPAVLIVGHIWDIRDGKLDSSCLKIFFVPADTCVELYATTLHYAPCMATSAGVRQVVCQIEGTNTDLTHSELLNDEGENPLLYQKNKWVLIHPEAADLFDPTAKQGITGENISIRPVDL